MISFNGDEDTQKDQSLPCYPYIHSLSLGCLISSVQFSHSVVSDSSQPHELQHGRPPCPSPTPGVYSNSCPLHRWCHSTISSSVVPFSSRPRSFPASESFQMSQFFTSGGQSIGVSASASVLPMNIQDWFPLGWTGWISSASHVAKAWLSLTRPVRGAHRGGTGSEAPLLCPLWHSDSQPLTSLAEVAHRSFWFWKRLSQALWYTLCGEVQSAGKDKSPI